MGISGPRLLAVTVVWPDALTESKVRVRNPKFRVKGFVETGVLSGGRASCSTAPMSHAPSIRAKPRWSVVWQEPLAPLSIASEGGRIQGESTG